MRIQKIIVGELQTNCYIISDNKNCFIIDPGDEHEKIFKAINSFDLKFILLTHGHYDHVLAIPEIHKKYPKVPIYIAKEDERLLVNLQEQQCYSNKKLSGINIKPKNVTDGKIIKFNKYDIKVIKTPGHSFGSVCYLVGDNLFSGDTLFYHTIGRTDFWTGNHAAMISTLKKLAKLPKDIKVYSGHGGTTTIQEEHQNGYLK